MVDWKRLGKYQVKTTCSNCGQTQMHSVPKGVTIQEYFKDKSMGSCNNCGCYSLEVAKKYAEIEERKEPEKEPDPFFNDRRRRRIR